MPNFFGVNRLGPPNIFASSSKHHCDHCDQEPRKSLAQVPHRLFTEAFQKRRETANLTHQVRRIHVPEIIESVLGRKLDSDEYQLMVRYFDIDHGNISPKEFENNLWRLQHAQGEHEAKASVKKTACGTGPVCEIPKRISYAEIIDQKVKHTRNDFEPCDVTQYPMTDSQQYGWDIQSRTKPREKYFPRKQQDVTKNEGICLDNYYPTF